MLLGDPFELLEVLLHFGLEVIYRSAIMLYKIQIFDQLHSIRLFLNRTVEIDWALVDLILSSRCTLTCTDAHVNILQVVFIIT